MNTVLQGFCLLGSSMVEYLLTPAERGASLPFYTVTLSYPTMILIKTHIVETTQVS